MKYIELSQGFRAVVDDEDFEYLNQWKWCYSNGWAVRKIYHKEDGSLENVSMHNLVAKPSEGMIIDHISRDSLDNRKVNLRECTWKENTRNRGISKQNTSGYKGVIKTGKKWRARITVNERQLQLGYFTSVKEAAKAYNKAAKKYFGEFAYLNKI